MFDSDWPLISLPRLHLTNNVTCTVYVPGGCRHSNNHSLEGNFHQSFSFEYHPRLQLLKEIQTHSGSFIACIPTWQQSEENISFLFFFWGTCIFKKKKKKSTIATMSLLEAAPLQPFLEIRVWAWNGILLMTPCVAGLLVFHKTNCFH